MESPTPIPFWGITASKHGDMRFDSTVDLDGAPTAWGLVQAVEHIENVGMLLFHILLTHVVYCPTGYA
jgi:hypothetical protein